MGAAGARLVDEGDESATWPERLTRLQREFSGAVTLYPPAASDDLRRTEEWLGVGLADMDPGWLDLLRVTNGASVLDYCFAGAETSRVRSIVGANACFRDIGAYGWAKERLVSFMGNSSSMNVGFAREGRQMRCVCYLGEPTDVAVLPIASSFGVFMESFLQDVEDRLRGWRPPPGQPWPYGISEVWPLDLGSWCDRDPALGAALKRGQLDDLFQGRGDYAALVKEVVYG